jgi:agmatine/peptidylarginine deiminase
MSQFLFRVVIVWFIVSTGRVQAQPPVAPVTPPIEGTRVAAEWEPALGVLIAWPLKIPKSLVVELVKDVPLYVTVKDKVSEQQARTTFENWGIAPQRVSFIVTGQGKCYCWTRDWGPFAVFDPAGKYKLVDGIFHGYPRSGLDSSKPLILATYMPILDVRSDDAAPGAIAAALGAKRTELPIALTGGNVVFDGLGTGLATQLLIDENIQMMGVSKEKFLDLVKQELGVMRFHSLPNFDTKLGNQHADCLFKQLDEERILIKRAPQNHFNFNSIETVAQELAKLKNAYGRPYQILRIDTPPYSGSSLANYTNSLILNRKIYVPMFGIPGDEKALATFREAMPGYDVIGFAFNPGEGKWFYSDALHCRTRAIWDQKMLYMTHRRMDSHVTAADEYAMAVQIRDYSGAGLVEGKLQLHWRPAGSAKWTEVSLKASGQKHTFQAVIQGPQAGQTIEYYLSAASQSGRAETLPRTAPKGVYSFKVVPKS